MSSLAAFLGIILSIAYSRLKVEEDPRIEELLRILPGINCSVCGSASCKEFARKLIIKETKIEDCKITSRNKGLVDKINDIIDN